MKLRQTVSLVAAGVMVVGSAITGAGSAAAATPEQLCVASEDDICATPNGSYPVLMNNYSFSFTDWLYNGPNHPGQIQVDGQDLCMQLDHAAGNTVILATCNGASYQKWAAFYAPGGWAFYSEWDTTQCLTYNRDYTELDTVTCDGAWYQSFNQGS